MHRRLARRGTTLAFLLLLQSAGCEREAIHWDDPMPLAPELAASSQLRFDPQNRLTPSPPPTIEPPVFTGQCAGSVRIAHDTTGDWFAVWWSSRPDSTAVLLSSRSADGVSWTATVSIDTVDAGKTGCIRPPPSIAANGTSVLVAYAMRAKEGAGVFFSHSIDRGLTFHSPVTVVYGEPLGVTDVAGRGDLVAVAYDDPNSTQRRVSLVLSRSQGHLFESRMVVSPSNGVARSPSVAFGDGKIAVSWAAGLPTDASAPRMVRIGTIR